MRHYIEVREDHAQRGARLGVVKSLPGDDHRAYLGHVADALEAAAARIRQELATGAQR